MERCSYRPAAATKNLSSARRSSGAGPSRNRRKCRFQGTWQAWRTLSQNRDPDDRHRYSRGYDSDIDSTSGYTQSTEVWFP
jgi:hypothetical protein